MFTWNGTTSGVRVPNADFIADDREGVTICDATSAAFAQDLDWAKLDVVTFSWQKAMGGEAAHGMLILSPRAVARLESYSPPWPLPKIFRLTKGLKWGASIGGLPALQARSNANLQVLADWIAKTSWVEFLAETPAIRSNTSVCIKVVDKRVTDLPPDAQADFAKKLASLLEKEGVALDAGGYRDAPPGLRIWCGATVDASDVEALTPWLDWAFQTLASELQSA